MPTTLITGAARGIGRALACSYLADGWRVLAVCRNPAALAGLDGLADAARLDVTDDEGIAALATRWRDECIDVLWNNAGVDSPNTRSLARLDTEEWARCLRVNTIAPVAMAAAFAGGLYRKVTFRCHSGSSRRMLKGRKIALRIVSSDAPGMSYSASMSALLG